MILTFQEPCQCSCADPSLQVCCQASGLDQGTCQVLLETYESSLQSRNLSHHKMQNSQPFSISSHPQLSSSSGGVGRGWEDIYSPLWHFSYLTEPSGSCFSELSASGLRPSRILQAGCRADQVL